MPNITSINASTFKIVFDKYSEVLIGGDTTDFKPEALLKKWGDECWIKVSYPTTKNISPIHYGGKIKWKDTDKEVHMYPLDDKNFEFEVILKSKPATNKIVLNIESKGLNFYYQPELTQKEKDEGAFQPENVIGSYAVYHESKQGNYEALGGKNYRAGKMGHFYYPYMIDSNGWKVRAEDFNVEIGENGKGEAIITAPQDFIDNAVYPIRHAAGLTFGYEDKGSGSVRLDDGDRVYGGRYQILEEGTATSITGWFAVVDIAEPFKMAIYNSDATGFIKGTEDVYSGSTGDKELKADLTSTELLTQDNYYYLVAMARDENSSTKIYRDVSGGTGITYFDADLNYGNFPNDISSGTGTNGKFSIYATYTPSVGQEETASYTPLSVVLTVPSITATFVSALTATITAISLLVSVPAISASYVQEESATFTPVSVVLTIPATTASYVQEEDSVFDSLSVVLTIPSNTATYVSELSAEYTALSIVVSIPSITASFPSEFSAVYSALSLLLEIPSMTPTFQAVINISKNSVSVTNISKNSASTTNISKNNSDTTNSTKTDASVTNTAKNSASITNQSKT